MRWATLGLAAWLSAIAQNCGQLSVSLGDNVTEEN